MRNTKKNILSYIFLISFIGIGIYFYIKDYSISKNIVKLNILGHEVEIEKNSKADEISNNKEFNSVMLANIAGQMEVPEEAAKYTEEALKNAAEEDKFKIYFNLAKVYEENEQHTQAMEIINKAIKHNPKCWTCYNLRGLSNLGLNNINQALADFNKSIELSEGKDPVPFQNRYLIYNFHLINRKLAIADLKMAIKIDPKALTAYTTLFLAYHFQNKFDDFKLLWQEYKANFDLKEPEYQAISWFLESYIHIHNSNYNESARLLKKSIHSYIKLIEKGVYMEEIDTLYLTIKNIIRQLNLYNQFDQVKKLIDLSYKIEKLWNNNELKFFLDDMSQKRHYKSKNKSVVELLQMEPIE